MAKVDVPIRAPATAVGAGVTEALKSSVYVCKGPSLSYDATGVIPLFQVPAGTFVHDVILNVTTAWANSSTSVPTLLLGDSDDYDRFMLAAISVPKTAGSKSIKAGTAVNSGGKLYTADALIVASLTDATGVSAAGAAGTYLIYSNYGELL